MKIEAAKIIIKENLVSYISKEFFKNDNIILSSKYPLLEKGVIDSLSMMSIIIYLEKKYNLDFYQIDITRNDFRTITSICDIVINNIDINTCRGLKNEKQ